MADKYTLCLPALRIRQGKHYIYCFGVDGKRIHDFTTVSRVRREDDHLQGYQRPEVLSHINAIRRYLESDGAMLPNAVVLAFDERVKFKVSKTATLVDYTTVGELIIPIDEALPENDKPAWLVDGQQRSAAIRDAELAEFPIAAVGFIADGQDHQRSQFILVNNTKPLPKGLIHELLPDTAGHLPARYARRQLPTRIMARLNNEVTTQSDIDSPFRGLISTPTVPDGYIKDNSVLKMIENSLYEGALYQYRDPRDGSGDEEAMLLHLKIFWGLVKATFPEAWSLPPRKSRLSHGVGIQALGYVMDHLTDGIPARELPTLDLGKPLARLKSVCAWTSGVWEFGNGESRRWNGLQNTPSDVRLLSNHLLRSIR
ncbi:DGQHR domain protein [Kribbella flavida DSM 17836]|uniref:DGQHR domain protein n=1 Tax=Kribbella flavida (strain DSM 17836 / JCM 10339 / NBRC 14399) TaxID=479435 RepID=D2PYU8_KRIFD|nr:DGQHR domain-containing protein DpdB [Kribbella flavida]ADB29944.1 DGQHR domain protein [Kribbella flavida DSM 17836]